MEDQSTTNSNNLGEQQSFTVSANTPTPSATISSTTTTVTSVTVNSGNSQVVYTPNLSRPLYEPTIYSELDFPYTVRSTPAVQERSYNDMINRRIELIKGSSKMFSLKFDYRRKKGYHTLVKRLGEQRMDILCSMKSVLDEVYPDRFDLQFELEAVTESEINTYGANSSKAFTVIKGIRISYIYIIIWYPEINIRNKKNQTTLIRDLYVRVPIFMSRLPFNTMSIDLMEGTRTTLSMAEYESGYLHSHLPTLRSSHCEFNHFCLGQSDVHMAVGLINTDLAKSKLDPDTFKAFLLSIQTYLEWESTETRPYTLMESAIKRSYDYPDATQDTCVAIFNILYKVICNGVKLDLDWSFAKGKYYIIDNDKLENLLYGVGITSLNNNGTMLFKDSTGRYFIENDSIDFAVLQDSWIPFQNEKKFFRIEGEIKKAINRRKFIHPKIKEYVKSKLELYANYAKVREAGINKLDTYNNTR